MARAEEHTKGRRLSVVAAVTATATLGCGLAAFAALGGVGLFGSDGPAADGTASLTFPPDGSAADTIEGTTPATGGATPVAEPPATSPRSSAGRPSGATSTPTGSSGTSGSSGSTDSTQGTTQATSGSSTATTVKSTTSAPSTSTATTTAATTATTTATTTKPALYTVTGQLIPSNWQVSSSWVKSGKTIPAYPAGSSYCQLEDSGVWNCEH